MSIFGLMLLFLQQFVFIVILVEIGILIYFD